MTLVQCGRECNSPKSWNYIGANRSSSSFVAQFYDSVSFLVYVGLKCRATDKMMARKGLRWKRLLSNGRNMPEYGGKEMVRVVGGRDQAEGYSAQLHQYELNITH
jgi:hypothetical protein